MDEYIPTPRERLQERVKRVLEERGTDPTHHQWYLDNLTAEAVQEYADHPERFTDQAIGNCIGAKELFWGLGTALANYIKWEKEQI
jgi:hypothetical protein